MNNAIILQYLSELEQNNDRGWYHANKDILHSSIAYLQGGDIISGCISYGEKSVMEDKNVYQQAREEINMTLRFSLNTLYFAVFIDTKHQISFL